MDSGIYVLVGIVILAILVISGLYLLLKKLTSEVSIMLKK